MTVTTLEKPNLNGQETIFAFGSLIVFCFIVFGLHLTSDKVVLVRSFLLVVFAFSVIYLQFRFSLLRGGVIDKRINLLSITYWGTICFLCHLLMAFGSILVFRNFVETANHKFYFHDIDNRPVLLKLFVAFAAASSEEVIYRFVWFRYLLSRRLSSLPLRYILAFSISSLAFGFGHFHAGIEKCILASFSGLIFAVFYLQKRNIWVVIIGHFLGDALAFVVQHHL